MFVGGEHAGTPTGMSRPLRGALLSPFLGQRLVLLPARESAADYEHLTRVIETGQFAPSLDRTYPLEQAPDAMRSLESGQIRGTVALTA